MDKADAADSEETANDSFTTSSTDDKSCDTTLLTAGQIIIIIIIIQHLYSAIMSYADTEALKFDSLFCSHLLPFIHSEEGLNHISMPSSL